MNGSTNEFSRGWAVLLSCFIGIGVCLNSIIYYSAGIWVKPWQAEFGWSRAEIGGGIGAVTFIMALTAPFVGSLIDKYGLKKMVILSLFLYAGGIYLFRFLDGSILMMYLLYMLLALVALPSTPLGFTRAINSWFHTNKGLALGISLTSSGVAAFLIPKYLTPYVAEHGWRDGFLILVYIVLIALPIIWLLLKENPPANQQIAADQSEVTYSGLTIKEASKTKTFWKVGFVFFLISTGVIGLVPNFIPLLQDAGLSPTEAGGYAAIMGLSVVVGRLLTGFLVDRFFAPRVVAVVFSIVAICCLVLCFGGVKYALLGAIGLGLAIGSEVDLIGYFTAKYFGLKHYGSIYGAMYSFFCVGALASPILAGYIWDKTGNYNLALIIAAIAVMLAVIVAQTFPKFKEG